MTQQDRAPIPWHVLRATLDLLAGLLGGFAILYGLLLILSGDERWGTETYATALRLWAAPESWGVAFVLSGGLLMYGNFYRRRATLLVGTALGAITTAMLGAALFVEYLGKEQVGADGALIFWWFSVAFGVSFFLHKKWGL